MKLRKAILLFLMLAAGRVAAQEPFSPEWNIGAGGGPTFADFSFEPGIDTKMLQQLHGGIALRYISEKNLGIIGEVNYSQQGWAGNFKDNPEYEHTHSFSYLEIPVMTHIYFGRQVRFFVNLGPKIQFLLSEKETINAALASYIESLSANENAAQLTRQYYKTAKYSFDYGLIGGAGLELRTKIGNFALEGRYYAGFGDLFDNHAGANNFTRSANRVLSAKLTYYVKVF
ncbi:MAG: PorT family protein [Prevotella sp.]|jgi:hypothetical protein|nr:PorT family protein [Prevotella sp.]